MFHVEHFIDTFLPDIHKESFFKQLGFIEQEYFKWNKHINISSLRDTAGFWLRHILDSLCLVKYIYDKQSPGDIFDIGSGGGFPGLVLAISLPNSVRMFEPIRKKTDFIEHCLLRLNLDKSQALAQRYQDIKSLPERSIVVSRALGKYKEMCEYFFKLDSNLEIVLMSTKTELDKLKDFKLEIFNESYDFINLRLKNTFENNVLVKVNR
jgi:16S rRNA (guanine(527)-N(7))-methyltransferase RsmG